jgi:recombination protein RecR
MCPECGFFAEDGMCQICQSQTRQRDVLCVVESQTDVLAFEKSGAFSGLYHVLHGLLSPLDGIGPEELKLPELFARIKKLNVREVVLGLSADVRGETTAIYLANELKPMGVSVTQLATGIAVGSGLEFVDSVTLSHALQQRKPV